MTRLYDLIPAHSAIMAELEQCVDDPERLQMLLDTLESVDMAVEVKADGYARMIAMFEDTNKLETEAKRLTARANAQKNVAKALRERLKMAMVAMGKEKIKTDLFTIVLQN